jgi:hypothetical protein
MDGEPEWVAAQREENRRFNNVWRGMFVGNVLSAVILILVISAERRTYLSIGGYVFAFVSIVSLYAAVHSPSGALMRSATITMTLLFTFAALIFLFGGVKS